MQIIKKNFSVILITLISLGVIFYLRRQISSLMKENLDLKNSNNELKKLSVKAYSEIENIKKNFFNDTENSDFKNNLNHEKIKELNHEDVIEEDIIEEDVINHNLDEEKPPIEMITIPDQINEFIIMSETIPDVDSQLVNNLIDSNLVHLPFNNINSNIEVLDDNEQIIKEIEDDTNNKELSNNNNEEIENIIINHGIPKEEEIVEEIIIDKPDEHDISSKNDELKENVKVLKLNNIEKPKEESKLNIKFQPKEDKNRTDSESEKSLDYTNNDYFEINNNFTKQPEKIIKAEPNKFEFISENYNINNASLSNLEKLNIRDIQNISKRYKLDVKKLNSKGDKKINKTKKELCTEIISYLNI